MIQLEVNGKSHNVDVPEDTPLLWVLREELQLKGTKFGCGRGLCGACTIHLQGSATRSCILPVMAAQGQKVTTIEGISAGHHLHPVQQAWIAENVPQCGYCQSGQIMQAVSLLNSKAQHTITELEAGMGGNLCRCGTYHKIKLALKKAARSMNKLRS